MPGNLHQAAWLVSPMLSAGQNRSGLGGVVRWGKWPLARQAMSFFQNCITNKAACPCFYVDALVFHCISVFLCKMLINKNVLIITKLFQNLGGILRSECKNVLNKNINIIYLVYYQRNFRLAILWLTICLVPFHECKARAVA